MRKWAALFLLFVLWIVAGCEEGERDYSIDEVNVKAQVLPDGDLYVEELFTYSFSGTYEHTKRAVELGEHNGVEFFEAYVPPLGGKLGTFSHEGLKQLQTRFDSGNDTFYVDFPSKDEKKQVYYRYRVDQAASKYVKTGELHWKFFNNNETDLHQVRMELTLPKPAGDGNVHAFLHDRTGGTVQWKNGAVRYENEKLSEFGDAELRILFPADSLAESPTKSKAMDVERILESEKNQAARVANRDQLLPAGKRMLKIVLLIAALLILWYGFRLPQWTARWSRHKKSFEELEEAEPVWIVYLYRKGRLKPGDYVAGLFSMVQRGMLRVSETEAENRLRAEAGAPHRVLRFLYPGNAGSLQGKESDRLLLRWLFRARSEEGRSFTMDSAAGPTKTERSKRKRVHHYRNRMSGFRRRFEEWVELEKEQQGLDAFFQENRLRKPFLIGTMIFHAVLILTLYIMDAAPWSDWWIALGLLCLGLLIAVWKAEKKRYIIGYYVFGFIIAAQLAEDTYTSGYSMIAILSIILIPILPRTAMSREAAAYRSSILAWRRQLKKGAPYADVDVDRWERLAHYAVLLEAGMPYVRKVLQRMKEAGVSTNSIWLKPGVMQGVVYVQSTMAELAPAKAAGSSTGGSGSGDSGYSGGSSDSGSGDGGGTGAD
ncbi:DUF2207 domain-containing protein [Paenibacillus sp. GD4]|uniref:DUF2207 domain-containing protein n=1 Tax=Paenibacillus sp. GD4 TaxID=3068890 RepID=UPI0027965D80|nr:DUF2207 domain-containing protein [Paenibacillus sp. GD4]MDQ1909302.1 DUF2207 domain-containing protein [Paenibacillus sp. GD4]